MFHVITGDRSPSRPDGKSSASVRFIRLDKEGGVRKTSIAPSIMTQQNTTGYVKRLAKTRM
jgi:hypothetical protein